MRRRHRVYFSRQAIEALQLLRAVAGMVEGYPFPSLCRRSVPMAERLNTQQFAHVDDPFEPARPVQRSRGPIVDAAKRFVARGGSWEPDERLMRRIEAAALGRPSCPRVRLVQ